jgi:hypothetical protein
VIAEVPAGEWDDVLAELGVADAYLLRAYVEASALLEPGEPRFLRAGDVVFAAVEREIPGAGGSRDLTTPYGYGGPAGPGHGERFHAAYEAWCRERGAVTTFVRYHPLLENQRLAPRSLDLVRVADTATWPLPADADLLAAMHSMHRRGVRKALRAGVRATITPAPDALDDFVALYEEGMRRRDAHGFYFFPGPYWDALLRLGERLLRLDARSAEGELLAGMLCLATPPWLHYHLGAATEHGYALGASKLLFLEAALHGQANGYAELHLGSGLGGSEDSLWEFKQRFSPAPGRAFWVGRLVHDAERYRELSGGRAGGDGYFPSYRAPAPVETGG